MGAVIEVSYFNTFIIKSDTNDVPDPGVDYLYWHIEESRIRGGYNEPSVDLGVKAYIANEEYSRRRRKNSLIFSGPYNVRTGINKTNEFSDAEDITKSLDIAHGSIQKLYAEETNLIVIQEDKISSILVDKDAIYTAEGGGIITSTEKILGQVVPYKGIYGTKHPESFAVGDSGRKYIFDFNRGAVLRLSQDGITEISKYGMHNFFRDISQYVEKAVGGFDEHNSLYTLSLQGTLVGSDGIFIDMEGFVTKQFGLGSEDTSGEYSTLVFDEDNKGWISFVTYKPDIILSLNNKFYSSKNGDLWEHDSSSYYNVFYDQFDNNADSSYVQFIFNTNPSNAKYIKTVNYEGSSKWRMSESITDLGDEAAVIYNSDTTYIDEDGYLQSAGFENDEGKYFAPIINTSSIRSNEIISGTDMAGIKGMFSTVKFEVLGDDVKRNKVELFSVSHKYNISKV